jgi:hypothetical protein
MRSLTIQFPQSIGRYRDHQTLPIRRCGGALPANPDIYSFILRALHTTRHRKHDRLYRFSPAKLYA